MHRPVTACKLRGCKCREGAGWLTSGDPGARAQVCSTEGLWLLFYTLLYYLMFHTAETSFVMIQRPVKKRGRLAL